MSRPFRRYCFSLAERLGLTVRELLERMDSTEISEWIAYDNTNNEKWVEKYKYEESLAASRAMSKEEKLKAFKRLLGPGNG